MDTDNVNQPSSELLQWFGPVAPRHHPEDFQEIRAEFENSVAQEVISEDNETSTSTTKNGHLYE